MVGEVKDASSSFRRHIRSKVALVILDPSAAFCGTYIGVFVGE